VARAALASKRISANAGAAVGGSVPRRVELLLGDEPLPSRWPLLLAGLVVIAVLSTSIEAGDDCLRLFQWAHDALLHRGH
jgi:hypothetical protein